MRIVLYAPDEAAADSASDAAFRRYAELDQIMSDYRPSSELSRLCAKAGGPPVKVGEELFSVLQKSQELSRRSGGGFDVTVGPEVVLWRRARKLHQFPSESELAAARALVGWQKIKLDPSARTVQLLIPGMRLDLGGIAKGYADDEAIAVLKRNGIRSALVEAGGDIAMSGPPPGANGWKIEVPNAATGSTLPDIPFSNCGVSTSGDTEQFVELGGKRYSHIVDPRSGLGTTNRLAVTIVAPNAATSDGLSTAVSVIGEERGRALVACYHARCYIRTVSGTQGRSRPPAARRGSGVG